MVKKKQKQGYVEKRSKVRKAQDILADLAEEFYDNRCFVTHRKFKKAGFTLHHLWYYFNDVVRSNYPKNAEGRDQYYRDLEPLVRAEPERFMLITNGTHTRIDHFQRGLSRMKRDSFLRLVLAVLMTKK